MDGQPRLVAPGILAVGNAHKAKAKLTFPQGAKLADPKKVFNAGLGGKAWQAIDLFEGDTVPAAAFTTLLRTAARHNVTNDAKGAKGAKK